MTIELRVTNPLDHSPRELTLAADFLNRLAAEATLQAELQQEARLPYKNSAVGFTVAEHPTVTVTPTTVAPAGGDHAPEAPRAPQPDAFSADRDAELDPAQVFTQAPPAPSATPTESSAPPAPSAPAAPAAPGVSVAVDKAGLPWDPRIHSESKAINKGDGLWRAKRGRDETIVPGIEAELRALMAVQAPAPNVAPAAPTTPVAPAAAPAAPESPAAPTAPPAPPAPAPASNGVPTNLGELMIKAQQAVNAGRMQMVDLTLAAQELGVAALPLLGTRPDLIPAVYEKLKDKLQ